MSNYFDNQTSWEWNVSKDKAVVVTDHGTHTHTINLTDVSIGDLSENTGKTLGDAHRSAPHDFKSSEETDSGNERSSFLEKIRCDKTTIDKVNDSSLNSQSPISKTAVAVDNGSKIGDEGRGNLGPKSGLNGDVSSQAWSNSGPQSSSSMSNNGSGEQGGIGGQGGQGVPGGGQGGHGGH